MQSVLEFKQEIIWKEFQFIADLWNVWSLFVAFNEEVLPSCDTNKHSLWTVQHQVHLKTIAASPEYKLWDNALHYSQENTPAVHHSTLLRRKPLLPAVQRHVWAE